MFRINSRSTLWQWEHDRIISHSIKVPGHPAQSVETYGRGSDAEQPRPLPHQRAVAALIGFVDIWLVVSMGGVGFARPLCMD